MREMALILAFRNMPQLGWQPEAREEVVQAGW
jgi:hypothetical protein